MEIFIQANLRIITWATRLSEFWALFQRGEGGDFREMKSESCEFQVYLGTNWGL